jgi:hypothetical protein
VKRRTPAFFPALCIQRACRIQRIGIQEHYSIELRTGLIVRSDPGEAEFDQLLRVQRAFIESFVDIRNGCGRELECFCCGSRCQAKQRNHRYAAGLREKPADNSS